MKKSLLRFATFLVICSFSTLTLAQDIWTPSELTGFANDQNSRTKTMHAFKGYLYAGAGDDKGIVYRSSTGNFGTWDSVLAPSMAMGIDKIISTNEGGGYIYASTYASGNDNPKVYRSVDGINWTFYYKGMGRIDNMIAFKGLGAIDSIYIFEQGSTGETIIKRASFDNNDPLDTLGTWQTVFQFPDYTTVTSTHIYNGKLYMATNNGATLWSTTNGTVYTQNTFVGSGFGDLNTGAISALGSFGGYVYAGTNTYYAAQIWRSNNDTVWSQVGSFQNFGNITSFEVANGQLWASMSIATNGPGRIVKTSDGETFTISDSTGFGYQYNQGFYGNMAVFGNNLYYASENYGYPGIAPNGEMNRSTTFSTGGQIWRMCFGVAPEISAGADQIKCAGSDATFNADAGYAFYAWDDGSTGQSLITSVAGNHYVVATDANGCSALDNVNLSTITSPAIFATNPYMGFPAYVCKGDSINLTNYATSNLRVDLAPVNTICNHQFYDYTTIYDTLNISGVNDFASTALLSVTIDSLYHTNDGDLTIGLYAPDGSYIELTNMTGYASQNYIGTVFSPTAPNYTYSDYGPFTGSYLPFTPFTNLTGNANGNWVLTVSDISVGSDLGTLKGWSLRFSLPDTIMDYSWSPSIGLSADSILSPVATPLVNTDYTLTVTNSIGCTATITDTLKVPQISITATSDSLCAGTTSILYAQGGINPVWSPAATLSSSAGMNVTATPTATTTYMVNDTLSGCAVTDSIKIFSNPALIISAGAAQNICFNDSTTINANATGGTAPYSYIWTEGANSYPNQTEQVAPSSSTTYNLLVTDAVGCLQFSAVDVTVTPSTGIYGHAGYSLGNVKSSNVVLFKYEPFLTHFDTVQVTTTDTSGNFNFNSVDHADYLIKIFPNPTYTTLVPTYYGDSFIWADSLKLAHGCGAPDTINILVVEEIPGVAGPGYLHGVIREGEGFGRAPGGPVPGIDVKLGRNPSGNGLVSSTQTNGSGEYTFASVPYGDYIIYADIPGIGCDSSYTITVNEANSAYNNLDYVVDSTNIRIDTTAMVGITDPSVKENKFSVYPNPSKGNATIEYTINTDTHVSLGIYNVLGVKISELVNGKQSAGTYKVNIDDKNKNLSSGVYFIALVTEDKTTLHKIIITE